MFLVTNENIYCVNISSCNLVGYHFFMLAFLKRASFCPPPMVYISVIITHIHTYYIFSSWYRPLCAAFRVLYQHLSFRLVGTPHLLFTFCCSISRRALGLFWWLVYLSFLLLFLHLEIKSILLFLTLFICFTSEYFVYQYSAASAV